MDFSQSAVFLDVSLTVFTFVVISVSTQFHHLFFGRPLSQLP
jgi:hypothetical protein